MAIIFILAIITAVFVIIQYKNAYPLPKTSVVAFTGTMGSGKTFSATKCLVREYKKRMLVWRVRNATWFLTGRRGESPTRPTVYSNIPLVVKPGRKKPVHALPLTRELMTCEDKFPENALVLIDEISILADQYDFDDPLVCERVGKLFKFYRHWTGGKIFVTEQALSCITKPLRDKMGFCYQCEGLERWLCIMPFVRVRIRPIVLVDAEVSSAGDMVTTDESPYLFFFALPFPLVPKHKRTYDSRCYRPIYHNGAVRLPDFYEDGLMTRYLLDIVSDSDRKAAYKKHKQTEKDWIYEDSEKE